MRETEEKTLAWSAPEFHYNEKSVDWFWAVGLIGIAAALAAIFFGNIIFGIFLLVATAVIGIFALFEPQPVYIEINRRGVMVNDALYPYANLESFWVEEETGHLYVKSKKLLMPYLPLPIGDTEPQEIRRHLHLHLKEVEHHEPFLQRLLEHFSF